MAEIRISNDGAVLVKYFTSTRRKQLHDSSQRSHISLSLHLHCHLGNALIQSHLQNFQTLQGATILVSN